MRRPSIQNRPSSRPQISREFLEEHRRRRYVEAAAELLHEFGRQGPTVTNIVRLAGTARNSFYEVFGGAEECIAYGITLAGAELFAALAAQDAQGEWAAEVLAAIAAFYGAVVAEPLRAELFLVHSAASRLEEGRAAARIGGERFAPLLARGRQEAAARGRGAPAALADEYLSRAIVFLAARRTMAGEVERLASEGRGMAILVAGFYLGPQAAEGIFATTSRAR